MRFIFDLDETLLSGGYECEESFFREQLGDSADKFLKVLPRLLDQYENDYSRYDIKELSSFLTQNSKVLITDDIIEGWIDANMKMSDNIENGAQEILEYLKSKKHSLVVLTNWFGNLQIERLKRAGLLEYFDKVYAGDEFVKPHKRAYFNACGNFKAKDCIVIGDNLVKDYITPRSLGLNAILYDKEEKYEKKLNKIKSLYELKDRY